MKTLSLYFDSKINLLEEVSTVTHLLEDAWDLSSIRFTKGAMNMCAATPFVRDVFLCAAESVNNMIHVIDKKRVEQDHPMEWPHILERLQERKLKVIQDGYMMLILSNAVHHIISRIGDTYTGLAEVKPNNFQEWLDESRRYVHEQHKYNQLKQLESMFNGHDTSRYLGTSFPLKNCTESLILYYTNGVALSDVLIHNISCQAISIELYNNAYDWVDRS
jgi:hypothetical protein